MVDPRAIALCQKIVVLTDDCIAKEMRCGFRIIFLQLAQCGDGQRDLPDSVRLKLADDCFTASKYPPEMPGIIPISAPKKYERFSGFYFISPRKLMGRFQLIEWDLTASVSSSSILLRLARSSQPAASL